MVDKLLNRGAYGNVTDSHERTPLHDVLAWARIDREKDVILTLVHLAKFGADPDTTTYRQTPQQLAETHLSVRVRDMFLTLRERTQIRRTKCNLSTRNLNLPNDIRTDVGIMRHNVDHLTLPDPGSSDIGILRRGGVSSKLPQDLFSHLAHPEKDLVETKRDAPTGRVDFILENSGWAPSSNTQLGKCFEAGTGTDQGDGWGVVHEPFPKLVAEASLNLTGTVASAAGIWSETKTAQLIKVFKHRHLPPFLHRYCRSLPRRSQPLANQAESAHTLLCRACPTPKPPNSGVA